MPTICERREASSWMCNFVRQAPLSPLNVSYETGACCRLRLKRLDGVAHLASRMVAKRSRAMAVGLGSPIKADEGQRLGAKAAKVSNASGRNTPTLTGGPATEEIHPQQFEWSLAIQPGKVGFQGFFKPSRAWTVTDATAFVAAIWRHGGPK